MTLPIICLISFVAICIVIAVIVRKEHKKQDNYRNSVITDGAHNSDTTFSTVCDDLSHCNGIRDGYN